MPGYDWPRLHAVLNDLPAALLVAAVFFDLVAAVTRRATFRQVGFWTLVLGVLGAAVAVISGLQAEDEIAHGDAVHRVMERHELLGFVTLGVFAALTVWRVVREGRMGRAERGAVLTASVAGVAALLATGLYGGRLVFDHAAGIPSSVLESELRSRTAGHHHEAGESHAHTDGADRHGAAGGSAAPGAASAGGVTDTTPATPTGAAGASTRTPAGTAGTGHAHPPGTPPHSHEERRPAHSHPRGTPPHRH